MTARPTNGGWNCGPARPSAQLGGYQSASMIYRKDVPITLPPAPWDAKQEEPET